MSQIHTLQLPRLPNELTIYTASEARAAWLDWLAGLDEGVPAGTLPPLDAADVESADGAGVQFLLSLLRTLDQRDLTLTLNAPSEALRNACLSAGVWPLPAGGAAA